MNENVNGGDDQYELKVAKSKKETKTSFVYVVHQWVTPDESQSVPGPRKFKVITTTVSLCLRLTVSFVVAAYDGWVRRKYEIARRFTDKVKLHIVSLVPMNFIATLTEIVVCRGKIESVFHVTSVVNLRPRIKWPQRRVATEDLSLCLPQPEKSVHCEVLHTPESGKVRADVVFIHGLHGSIFHTWKQGLWSYRKSVTSSPLEHKHKAMRDALSSGEISAIVESESICDRQEYVSDMIESLSRDYEDDDHDLVLENITDIINNLDDKIKGSKQGSDDLGNSEDEPYTTCWPRDWLPKDCPDIRVIAVNYTTDPFLWRPIWITKRIRTSMTERSEEMEDHLLKLGVGQHPIVWVGHSKGGLFVKQMLVDANESEDAPLKKFLHQTKAIMFYSVPHRGSSLAHINLPLLRQSIELTEVKKDCQEVLSLHTQFLKLYEKNILSAEVFSFVETVLTFMFITNVRIVSVDSADLGFGIFQGVNLDHREICKPLNRDCFLYKELANLINRVV